MVILNSSFGQTSPSFLDIKDLPVFDVKQYGAKGNGIADDAIPINRAAKAAAVAGGGTVYFPPGAYRITRAIRLENFDIETNTYYNHVARRNVAFVGSGDSTIIQPDGFYCSAFTNFPEPFIDGTELAAYVVEPIGTHVPYSTNIRIENLCIDMDYTSNVDGGAEYGGYYGTWGGTWPDGSTGSSTWAADNYQYGIYTYRTDGLKIANLTIKRSWYNGIEIYRCRDVNISNNSVLNCGDKANYLGHYSGIQFDNACQNLVLAGNIIRSCGYGIQANGTAQGDTISAIKNIIISTNIIASTTYSGMYFYEWLEHFNISNNYLENIGGSGINVAYNQAGDPAGGHPQYFIISQNTINKYANAGGERIGIRGMGENFTITNNILVKESVATDTLGIAIQDATVVDIRGYGVANIIANNSITGKFVMSSEDKPIIFMDADESSVVNNLITANNSSIVYSAIRADGSNCRVAGNNIVGDFIGDGIHFAYSENLSFSDPRFSPFTQAVLTTSMGSLSGWQTADFGGAGTTTVDLRQQFSVGSDSIVIDIPGLYEIVAVAHLLTTTTAQLTMIVEKNGASTPIFASAVASGSSTLTTKEAIFLSPGDSLRMRINAAASTYACASGTSLQVHLLDYNLAP